MSILLADDDAQLATFLSKSLESEGYSVHTALDESAVLSELQRQSYKLIILDLNFGQTDGLALLEKLRTGGVETPIIVLSARNRVADRIKSLNLGADDYVTKPFSFQELAARTSALLRRKTDPGLNVLRVEDLELDPVSRKAHRGNREIKLSPKEFDLLHMLMRHAGETISRNDMLQDCWGQESETDSNLVDVYVNYLRKKIDTVNEPKLIYTVRGAGYRIGPPAPTPLEADRNASQVAEEEQEEATVPLESEPAAVPESPARSLVHSLAHDLAQPLTSVRCFLEAVSLKSSAVTMQAGDIQAVEQQADRAIALTKGISALTRDLAHPETPSVSLDTLLNDVFNDFIVLVHSGFLTIERRWNTSIAVTSNPLLRQVVVLLLAKIIGKNPRPLVLSVNAELAQQKCEIKFSWRANNGSATMMDAGAILSKDLSSLQSLLDAVYGEIAAVTGRPEITLKLPALKETAKSTVH